MKEALVKLEIPQSNTIIFGFDSAWTDRPDAPGAICAIAFDGGGKSRFYPPELVSFDQAHQLISQRQQGYRFTLVAIDQPTIVPNLSGGRPVEKVAASLVSFVGGGVQPANRGKVGMFDDEAPIWRFQQSLQAREAPNEARVSSAGLYQIEVFPALALPSLNPDFAKRYGAPKYNPPNKRFRIEHWQQVCSVVEDNALLLGVPSLASWARDAREIEKPKKPNQDKLDSTLCALIGLMWRAAPQDRVAMLGDLSTGYMITPVSDATRERLRIAAHKKGITMS